MSKNLICCSKKKMRKDEEGSVVILVAVLMVVFLGMAALVVDLGADYVYKAKMQTACDTASRAAASALPDTTKATELAKYYMKENGFEDTSNVPGRISGL